MNTFALMQRHLPSVMLSAVLSLGGIGCGLNGAGDRPAAADRDHTGDGATQAGYGHPAENNASGSAGDGATPQGLNGGGAYDQPGQLPPNAGGTNAGRAGYRDPSREVNR